MAAADVIDPVSHAAVNDQQPGTGDRFDEPLPTTTLKKAEVSVLEEEVVAAPFTNGLSGAPETPVRDTQPNGRPADVLHEAYPKSDLELPDRHIDEV